ncbi:MAG: rRNA adenine methyltransferase [Caldiserica bacterium]|jgi:hypothetical protein|nr:rRNA adenine methyltransferase [Caldisericota bacterium]MDH7561849.1 rRNA adenine methyltransferase [Caldisericota bacterium]
MASPLFEDKDFEEFVRRNDLRDWEPCYHPSSEEVIEKVLNFISPSDIVLDIGGGNLSFSLRIAQKAKRVFSLEVNPLLVSQGLREIGFKIPRNLHVICANALDFPFPQGISVAVLIMRHCQHFSFYFSELEKIRCRFLITNSRLKTDVERIDLQAPRVPFSRFPGGWYACRCGGVGFKEGGNPDQFEPVEVNDCPHCSNVKERT